MVLLVVTWLASPARIRLRSLVPSRYLHELEYLSPVILSRGFVHLEPENHFPQLDRNARRSLTNDE